MELKVENNCFIMKGLSNHSNIYIYNNYDDSKLFFEKINGVFLLSIEKLISFFTRPKTILRLYNENNEIINIDTQKVHFESNTYLKQKNHNYYIFIDSNHNLSLIYNKKPSLNYFYNKDALYKGSSVDEGTVNLNFEFSVKYFKPTNLKVLIVVRKTKESKILKVNNFMVSELTLNQYKVRASLKLDIEDIQFLIGENNDISNYDFNVYDVFFHFEINELPLTDLTPKIGFNKSEEKIYED